MATPTSDFIDETGSTTAAANTVTMEISSTSTASGLSVAMVTITDSVVTYEESSTDSKPSTQFPMQHSTEPLPGNPVPVSTTDSMTMTSTEGQDILKSDSESSASVLSSESVSLASISVTPAAADTAHDVIPSMTTSVNDIASSTTSVKDMVPSTTLIVNDMNSSTTLSVNDTISSPSTRVPSDSSLSLSQDTTISDTSSTSVVLPTSAESQASSTLSTSSTEQNPLPSTISSEPLDPNSATQPLSDTATTQFVITTSATITDNLPSPSLDLYLTPSKAVATSGSSFSTYFPPHTDYTGLPSTMNTVISTSAAPLPAPSPIPSESSPKSQSTILGGNVFFSEPFFGKTGLNNACAYSPRLACAVLNFLFIGTGSLFLIKIQVYCKTTSSVCPLYKVVTIKGHHSQ